MDVKEIAKKVELARLEHPGKVYISRGGRHYHWPGCPMVSPASFEPYPEAYDYYMIEEKDLPKARTHGGGRFIPCPLCHYQESRRGSK